MKKLSHIFILFTVLLFIMGVSNSFGQKSEDNDVITKTLRSITLKVEDQNHLFDQLLKKNSDIMWFNLVGEISYIDIVRLVGPPRHNAKPTGDIFADQFINNPRIFHAYVFIPKSVDQNGKYPLIVFPHGGIHGTFNDANYHIVREWLMQGYIVIAPDYRGSIGYGKKGYRDIDYGGLENEDVLISRDYMVENYTIVDSERVGIAGWSHGGMISLMNIMRYPDSYACAFAGVPVSDVAYRLSYKRPGYTDNFTAEYHIGQSPEENPEEYARRSPITYAPLLHKPLFINANSNDDDVSVKEVQRMIDALLANNKDFVYEVNENIPGGHHFDRIDTKQATELRFKVHKFLEKYLNPPMPFKTHGEMRRAGYHFE